MVACLSPARIDCLTACWLNAERVALQNWPVGGLLFCGHGLQSGSLQDQCPQGVDDFVTSFWPLLFSDPLALKSSRRGWNVVFGTSSLCHPLWSSEAGRVGLAAWSGYQGSTQPLRVLGMGESVPSA